MLMLIPCPSSGLPEMSIRASELNHGAMEEGYEESHDHVHLPSKFL